MSVANNLAIECRTQNDFAPLRYANKERLYKCGTRSAECGTTSFRYRYTHKERMISAERGTALLREATQTRMLKLKNYLTYKNALV